MAQNTLGCIYIEGGPGVSRNPVKAVKYFKKAAKNGLAVAQHNRGMTFIVDEGIDENAIKSIKWLQRSAAQGYPGAQSFLKKNFVRISSEFEPQPSLSQEVLDQIERIKGELQELKSLYLHTISPTEQSNDEDKKENLNLTQLYTNIISSLTTYEEFVEYIDKPAFLISSIEMTEELLLPLQVKFSEDKVLEKIQKSRLQQDLQKLSEFDKELLENLSSADYAEKLNKLLENLVLETEAYHNTLFSQTYPWFFQ